MLLHEDLHKKFWVDPFLKLVHNFRTHQKVHLYSDKKYKSFGFSKLGGKNF